MYAVYAQCASVRPIQPFYLTKWEAPYKGYSPSAAWGVILSVERWETLDQVLEIGAGGVFPNLTAEQFARLTMNR
jgi:hypothetical protein